MSDPSQTDIVKALQHSPIGLCAACRHARVTGNTRGSRFYLCQLAESDARFSKYPRLPVRQCSGFELTAATSEDE
ncbi:MAG TPA: hypothetical protein VFF59_09690 [Anaerolineae bacterium]|nr:hypothetical protein [Anaerolineae bacterium]